MKLKNLQKKPTKSELDAEKALFRKNYGQKEARAYQRLIKKIRLEKPVFWWKDRNLFQKIGLILISIIILCVSSMYGIARWYIATQAHKEFKFGATFIPRYAKKFGLAPEPTMQAIIDDLNIRHFRLVSYWNDIEKSPGVYDFTELDWQFKKVEAANGTVSLAIGLRQPRWPECHMPAWQLGRPKSVWYPPLKTFMSKVIDRYKTSPALESYQLENEFFLDVFGECPDFSRERLIDEFNHVKKEDPNHTVIISRSNNALGLPIGDPRPDKFGISIYKRVWDSSITKRYFEYPFPAWFYAFLAGAGKIVTGKDLIVHELQAEPWGPNKEITDISITEQNKSLSPERLTHRVKFGKATGMREIDLWGVEMWYWRKVALNDPSLWEAGKKAIREQQCYDCYLPND